MCIRTGFRAFSKINRITIRLSEEKDSGEFIDLETLSDIHSGCKRVHPMNHRFHKVFLPDYR